jgi:hypothetical protein
MSTEHNDLDKLTKELLGKSLLKPASADFDDRLMDKIHLISSPAKLKSNGNITKKAWMLLMVTVVIMMFSVMLTATIPGSYFTEISKMLKLIYVYLLFGGLALFVPLIFFQLDLLLQLKFGRYTKGLSIE